MSKIILMELAFIVLSSCNSGFYTKEDFGSVDKIDSHVHLIGNLGSFEELALNDNFRLISLNVHHRDSSDIRNQQDYASAAAKKYPERIFFGPTFYFDTTGWGNETWSKKVISQLEKDLSEPGAVTVKIWKNIGMTVRDRSGKFIMIDDPGLDPVISFIISKGLPVTGHLGEPRNCWLPLDQMTMKSDSNYFSHNTQYHMYLHPDYPSYEDQINARDNLLKKHPDLIFIGCHLGSLEWNIDSLTLRLDRYPNMAVDIAARIWYLQWQSAKDREKVKKFIIKYQDRLLYGTDIGYGKSENNESMHSRWFDDWIYLVTDDEMISSRFRGSFTGLKLRKNVVNKIYYLNAVKWYKLKI